MRDHQQVNGTPSFALKVLSRLACRTALALLSATCATWTGRTQGCLRPEPCKSSKWPKRRHDSALWVRQNKTGTKRAIELIGEPAELIERINTRPRVRLSAYLIQDENGKPLGEIGLRSRFYKARALAGVDFHFRDIRAKTASDTGDSAHSQELLGQKNVT